MLPALGDGSWPIPGLPGSRRKLTPTGRTRASKVSSLVRFRTHTDGQKRHAPKDQIAVGQAVSRTSTVNDATSTGKRRFSYLRDQAADYLIPFS